MGHWLFRGAYSVNRRQGSSPRGVGAILLTASICGAATAAAGQRLPGNDVKRISARRVPNATIRIDGRMTEAEWSLVEPAVDFIQQQPAEGRPSTHPSEVRFLYDDEFLYIGSRLHEDEPEKLVTNELKRDFGSPRASDLFVLVIDTFLDKLNAYALEANPRCALRDAQSYDDGRTINANWDAVWFCRSSLSDDAWVMEMSVPFKQLRFPAKEEQMWGLQIFRLVRHSNEITFWNPVPRQFNEFKTSYEGVLDGIRGVHPGRNIRVKPFVTAKATGTSASATGTADGGFDTKIGLGTNLVLDGTYRTDFSNVEADAQQVNLTRFSLFFPEKREFFLENQGAFQLGPPAAANSNLVPFFSRTIGLSDTGVPIPIVGGARLTGKVGRNAIGIMNMQTSKEERSGLSPLPASNFTVLRYGREVLNNSLIGGFYMDKERGDTSNRIVGADLRFYPTRAWNIDAMVMRSEKTGVGAGTAWRSSVQYNAGLNLLSASYTSLGDTFRDDLGFIPRQGVDILNANILRRWRPRATRWIREFRSEGLFGRFTASSGVVQSAILTPAFTAELVDSSTAAVSYSRSEENLSTAFRPQGIPAGQAIPAGRYVFGTGSMSYTPSNARSVSPVGDYRFGDYYTGSRRGYTAGARVRFSPQLATTLSFSRDMVDLPGTSFHTDLASLRIDVSFSTRMFLNAFIQYNSVTHQVLSNVRYDFIHHPLSDIFITYNETRDSNGIQVPSRQLAVKLTHLLNF